MRSLYSLAACIVLSLTAPLLAGGPIGYIGDNEPANNTSGGAVQILFPTIGGNCTRVVSGILGMTIGDNDWYRVTLAAGERFCAMTTPLRSLPTTFLRPDTVIELRNPALTIVASNDDAGAGVTSSGNNNFGSVIRYIAPVAGDYYLHIYGLGNDEAGPYQLALIRHVQGCITWTGTSNNSPAAADVVGVHQANPLAIYCLVAAGDDDYWAFDLSAGDVVSAMTVPSGAAANFNLPDTRIDVIDINGVTILGTNTVDNADNVPASTAGATMRFRAPEDGRYYFLVTSTSVAVDNYALFVSYVPAAQCEGDANGDGVVNFADITATLTNWNFICR